MIFYFDSFDESFSKYTNRRNIVSFDVKPAYSLLLGSTVNAAERATSPAEEPYQSPACLTLAPQQQCRHPEHPQTQSYSKSSPDLRYA